MALIPQKKKDTMKINIPDRIIVLILSLRTNIPPYQLPIAVIIRKKAVPIPNT